LADLGYRTRFQAEFGLGCQGASGGIGGTSYVGRESLCCVHRMVSLWLAARNCDLTFAGVRSGDWMFRLVGCIVIPCIDILVESIIVCAARRMHEASDGERVRKGQMTNWGR
jgi:hypothetical protein